jgi:hypothetical protein
MKKLNKSVMTLKMMVSITSRKKMTRMMRKK